MERALAQLWLRATRRVESSFRDTAAHPSPTQLQLLELLDRGSLRLMAAAALLGVSGATCTRAVDAAARRGWLTKVRDPQDRRVVWVRITPEGHAARRGMEAILEMHLERLLRGAAAEERAAWERVLGQMGDGPGEE